MVRVVTTGERRCNVGRGAYGIYEPTTEPNAAVCMASVSAAAYVVAGVKPPGACTGRRSHRWWVVPCGLLDV